MPHEKTLESLFGVDHNTRRQTLERARVASALSIPYVLPQESQRANSELPENFQSLVARGVINLTGLMMGALFAELWFKLELAQSVKFDPSIPDDVKEQWKHALYLRTLMGLAMLESEDLSAEDYTNDDTGFRSHKQAVLTQLLVTGDTLEQFTDNYRFKLFRRDMYVTRRDSSSKILYHIIKETIDPFELPEEMMVKAQLDQSVSEAYVATDRMQDLYTRCMWQPQSRNWVMEQEMNGHLIAESEEPVTPFISTPFATVGGEDYGRGFVELMLGDARSYDELRERLLDFAVMASKHHPCLDAGSGARIKDLQQRSGLPIEGLRVTGGMVQDLAFLKVDKIGDFGVVQATAEAIRRDLSAAMLIESEIQPQKERVTKAQIDRIAQELDGATGGLYTPVSSRQQRPLVRRLYWQMRRDKLLGDLPEGLVNIKVLTGVAAFSSKTEAGKALNILQVLSQFGPSGLQRIKLGTLSRILEEAEGAKESIIKSEEEMAAEQAQAQQQQMLQQAAQQAIQTTGNITEQQTADQSAA